MKPINLALIAAGAVAAWFIYRRLNGASEPVTFSGNMFGPSRVTTVGGNTYLDGQLVYS